MALSYSKNPNARKFINCYNRVDTALRAQGDLKRSINYGEAVRRAAHANPIIAKYEDELLDFGRLRNAIVHNDNDNFIIAEPNTEIVEKFEMITELVCTPPLAINTVAKRVQGSQDGSMTLKEFMSFAYKSGFSLVPVYKDGMLIGVTNGQKIMEVLGKKVYEKQDIAKYIEQTTLEQVMKECNAHNYYAVASTKLTLDKLLLMFAQNRKLLLVLLTKTGGLLEKAEGIVTLSDLTEVNKVLDNYN